MRSGKRSITAPAPWPVTVTRCASTVTLAPAGDAPSADATAASSAIAAPCIDPAALLPPNCTNSRSHAARDRRARNAIKPSVALARSASRQGPDARALLRHVLVGVVARPHERAGGDILEAEVERGPLERGELVRVPVAHHRQVALRGPQGLTDGEHLHAALAQAAESIDHLVIRL